MQMWFYFLLKVKVIQNGKWLRWIPKGNHFSTSLEYKLISKLRRNSAFGVLYSKCCSFSARYPLCIHDTYNKQNHPTVTLWSSTSFHHYVNPEFNHLPYCTSVAFFCRCIFWKKIGLHDWFAEHKKILLKNRCIWMKPNMWTMFLIHLPINVVTLMPIRNAKWLPVEIRRKKKNHMTELLL